MPTGSHAFGQPAAPDALLNLELFLDADQPVERQDQLAVFAGRLGYRAIWLGAVAGAPELRRLATLRALSGDAVVGVSFRSLPPAASVATLPVDVRIEIPDPRDARDALIAAVGGVTAWSKRVRVRGHVDDDAQGVVVAASDRAGLLAAIAAVRARADGSSVVAAVAVSIGRTASEAAARASRDPRLADDRHPRHAGVFGTLDDAQEQVLALAGAGADTLLATLPDDVDVADLLAQLRSAVAGPTPVLHRRQR